MGAVALQISYDTFYQAISRRKFNFIFSSDGFTGYITEIERRDSCINLWVSTSHGTKLAPSIEKKRNKILRLKIGKDTLFITRDFNDNIIIVSSAKNRA